MNNNRIPRVSWLRWFAIAGAGVALAVAVALQIAPPVGAAPRELLSLKTLVPESLPGWEVRDEPIGETEAIKAAVKILDFDDMVYRSYTSGATTFSIYIAGWRAGKRAWPDVATHTPDICWPANGLECVRARSPFDLLAGDVRLERGQWREFRQGTRGTIHVAFWHYLDGRPLEYSPYQRFSGLSEAVRNMGRSRGVQYFVRVSSAVPIEELTRLPAFQTALRQIQGIR